MSVNPSSVAVPIGDTKHASLSQVERDAESNDWSVEARKEVFDLTQIDPVLARKMALINEAIEEIGMTPFQWKLFFLNGFGYAVDSVSSKSFHRCSADNQASHRLSIDSSARRIAGIWESNSKGCWSRTRFSSWSPDRCRPLGVHSRYYRKKDCV